MSLILRSAANLALIEEGGYKATWKRGIQTPMAQGRSTKIISMIKWIRDSRLSVKKSLFLALVEGVVTKVQVLGLIIRNCRGESAPVKLDFGSWS